MEHKHGTKVHYKVGDLEGSAIIVGIASNGQPLIGITYIVEDRSIGDDHGMMSETYPYTHFVLNELQFTVDVDQKEI